MIKRKNVFFLLLVISCVSCWSNSTKVLSPAIEGNSSDPAKQKLSFTPAKKINWLLVNMDTLKKIPPGYFSFNNLASKPLAVVDFSPLKKPITKIKFNPDTIPQSSFAIETITAQKLRFRVSVLGVPQHVKANSPRLKDGATQNLLLFGQDQGLPGTIGQSLLQDKQGSIWMGTDNGLCNYDGEYCNIYSMEQGLASNWAHHLMDDRFGRIWVGTDGQGIDVLDLKSGMIKHLGMKEGLLSNVILGIMEDTEGFIWVATSGGLQLIKEKSGTITHIGTNAGLKGNLVLNLLEDAKKQIWLTVVGSGMEIINKQDKTLRHLQNKNIIAYDSSATNIVQDNNGVVYTCSDNTGITMIDLQKGTIGKIGVEHGLSGMDVRYFAQDPTGKIWIATNGGGVDVFNPVTEEIMNFNATHGLTNNNVYSLLNDINGQIWIGTNGGEITIYPSTGIKLQHFTNEHGLTNKSSFVYALAEANDGNIWVGSLGGGINIIDKKNHTVKLFNRTSGLSDDDVQYLFTDDAGKIWAATTKGIDVIDTRLGKIEHMLKNSFVREIIQTGSDELVLAGQRELFIMNKKTQKIKVLNRSNGLNNAIIWCITRSKNGWLWIGTNQGLDILDEKAGTITHVNSDIFLDKSHILSLLTDSKGRVWAATGGGGVYMIDEQGNTTKFTVQEGLANDFVLSLVEKDGNIYAGTGKGLTIIKSVRDSDSGNTMQKQKWSLVSYGKAQGFLRVDFNPISLVSKNGRIWFTIADVLTEMQEAKMTDSNRLSTVIITGIDLMEKPQNFFSNNERNKIFLSADTLWGTDGNHFFIKDKLTADSGYLTSHQIYWDSIEGANRLPVNLRLPYNQNHITIHFTSNQLSNGDKTSYQYFLQGNDKSWSPVTDKEYADYRNLSAGHYEFKVRSKDFYGNWSPKSSFSFLVRSPWWKTWWAYLLYALLIGSIIGAYIHYRSKALRRENLVLEDKVNHRTGQLQKSLQDLQATQSQLIQSEKMASLGELTAGIAHEIQNPLNFVNNFSEVNRELITELVDEADKGNTEEVKAIANDIKENSEKINHHGKRADAIVKGMLQHSQSSIGKKEPTDINKLADEYLRLAFHGFRAKDKTFNATLKTDYDEGIGDINIIPQDIGRVILNLITNAFYAVNEKKTLRQAQGDKSYQPTVAVSTKKINDKVEIKVTDNGNGIPQKILDKIFQPFFTTKPTGQGTELGLSLAYDIVKAHGGELKVEAKEGEGATFTLILPISL